jgi:uncharacterized damage-inducible protein DinB
VPTLELHGRPDPPRTSGEVETLVGFLEFQRATLEWKCAGLDRDQLSTTTAASTMTLGGLLNHLAAVEDSWFSVVLHGHKPAAPWDEVDWDEDPDWEWRTALDEEPDDLRARWREAVERSRERVAQAIAVKGLDTPAVRTARNGTATSLRWILMHMIEEYARHNGHADLLRESIDGQTGQ